jgi:hypothetical protein
MIVGLYLWRPQDDGGEIKVFCINTLYTIHGATAYGHFRISSFHNFLALFFFFFSSLSLSLFFFFFFFFSLSLSLFLDRCFSRIHLVYLGCALALLIKFNYLLKDRDWRPLTAFGEGRFERGRDHIGRDSNSTTI